MIVPDSMRLCRILSNQSVMNIFEGGAIQAKLQVGAVDDKYEREANRVAKQIVTNAPLSERINDRNRKSSSNKMQRKCQVREDEQEKTIQLKPLPVYIRGELSKPSSLRHDFIRGGQSLEKQSRRYFESKLGYNFGEVHIHNNPKASFAASQLNARAFTMGNNIVFGGNQYQPDSTEGKQLLAHELVHVIQQSQTSNAPLIQRAETHEEIGCGTLKDSTSDFNGEVNRILGLAVTSVGLPIDAEKIGSDLGGMLPVTPIERFAETSLAADKIVNPAKSDTKYKGVTAHLWSIASRVLGPHVKVGGLCIGTDKLGHFFQQGFNYYKIMYRMLYVVEQRLNKLVRRGRWGCKA